MNGSSLAPHTPPYARPTESLPTPPSALKDAEDETTPKASSTPRITPRKSAQRSSMGGEAPVTANGTGITASISGLIANSLRNLANSLSPETAPSPSSSAASSGVPNLKLKTSVPASGASASHSPIARKVLDLPGELPASANERTERITKRDSFQLAPSRRLSGRESPAPSPGPATSLLPAYFGANFGSLFGAKSASAQPDGTIVGNRWEDSGEAHSTDLSMAEASAQGEVFPDTTTPVSSPNARTGFDFRPQTPRGMSRNSSLRLHEAISAPNSRRTTLVAPAGRTTPRASMEGSTGSGKEEGQPEEVEDEDDESGHPLDPITRAATARSQMSPDGSSPRSPLAGPSFHTRSFSVPTPPPTHLVKDHRNGHTGSTDERPPLRPQTAREPSDTSPVGSSSASELPRSGSDLSQRPPTAAKTKKTLLSRLGFGSAKSPSPSLSSHSRSSSTSSVVSPPARKASVGVISVASAERDDASVAPSLGDRGARPRHIKVRTKNKDQKELRHLFLAQELHIPAPTTSSDSASIASDDDPTGGDTTTPTPSKPRSQRKKKAAIWAMSFSRDGEYLAAAGQDGVIRVWQVDGGLPSPNGWPEVTTPEETPRTGSFGPLPTPTTASAGGSTSQRKRPKLAEVPVFANRPLHEWKGHTADVLDLSWSKNNFLLSASMDKTVRLWHISRKDCLSAFLHLDCAVAVAFHPRDDRFFLSGSLDCKLRLWNVPEKRVQAWTELPELITTVAFVNDGRLACAGSFAGRCTFFDIETFKYNTQFVSRSGRVKKGRKVTAIRSLPGNVNGGQDKVLVTTNDSRIRLFNLLDRSCEAKYRGHANQSSQIRASFSDDGKYIISGSEDRHVYVYDSGLSDGGSFVGWLKGRMDKGGCESFPAESDIATCCIFAPEPTRRVLARSGDLVFSQYTSNDTLAPMTTRASGFSTASYLSAGEPPVWLPPLKGLEDAIIVCADDHTGAIRVYRNSPFPKDHPCMRPSSRRSSHIVTARSTRSRAGSVISAGGPLDER